MRNEYSDADMMAGVVEEALLLQRAVEDSLTELRKTTASLARLQAQVPADVRLAIEGNLKGVATSAGEHVGTKLTGMLESAARATTAFDAARQRLTWQAAAFLSMLFLLMFSALVLAPWLISPDPGEIQQLRAERDELAEGIRQLRARGADALITQCIDSRNKKHTCVRVDDSNGDFNGYRVLYGH